MKKRNLRIIQIIPAVGWRAIFAVKPDEENSLPYIISDIVCWGLIEESFEDDVEGEEPYRYVKGLTSSDVPSWISVVDDLGSNFIAYIGPNEEPDIYSSACIDWLKERNPSTPS